MTNNEIRDMMYKRGFTFKTESKNYGEPKGLYFSSETLYDRRDRNKVVIPSYGCIIYPETDQFEFYAFKSSKFDVKLGTPKYEDFGDKDHFNRAADQFDEIMKQEFHKSLQNIYKDKGLIPTKQENIPTKQEKELLLTTEDLTFENVTQGSEL